MLGLEFVWKLIEKNYLKRQAKMLYEATYYTGWVSANTTLRSRAGVTGRWALLSLAQNAVGWLSFSIWEVETFRTRRLFMASHFSLFSLLATCMYGSYGVWWDLSKQCFSALLTQACPTVFNGSLNLATELIYRDCQLSDSCGRSFKNNCCPPDDSCWLPTSVTGRRSFPLHFPYSVSFSLLSSLPLTPFLPPLSLLSSLPLLLLSPSFSFHRPFSFLLSISFLSPSFLVV